MYILLGGMVKHLKCSTGASNFFVLFLLCSLSPDQQTLGVMKIGAGDSLRFQSKLNRRCFLTCTVYMRWTCCNTRQKYALAFLGACFYCG
uniref:Secreted protein n=1 Tax=Pyxicephalus adspersus TaxID=30357 RepID=A0AAV3ASC1_PYXAD|nr:TPA: hypothetical protein GDO54_001931 [Pyxicephalus adspersus]